MYKTPDGKEIFVLDGHTHFWDGSPENQRNIHGKQFIECFYAYHTNLSPPSERWEKSKFEKYSEDDVYNDLFIDGPDDMAIVQTTVLGDFYKNGFGNINRTHEMARRHPERFIINGAYDPRDGEKALEYIHWMKDTYDIKGVKLYTAEWNGDSKGYRLDDPASVRCLELCDKLGIKNIHVHKGPTIIPLNKDAFAVGDIDPVATDFQNLNFIVEHCGLPRLDDFCWIAVQETNVYAGLAVVMPFINARPRYFGEVIAELLFWVGPEKILFGSDYAIWTPKWLVEKFWNFQIPEDIATERGVQLTDEIKEKILGLNAARLYDIDVAAARARLDLVNDPELDEALTDLGFVEAVSVGDEGDVLVCFRLPTYWCSPNFAFLMAESIRREVGALPWVARVSVRLEDHMCADEMNEAVNHGRSFAEALTLGAEYADLADVREKFDGKAFQRRQEAVLLALRASGHTPEQVAAMTLAQLDLLSFTDPESARQLPRYRAILTERDLASAPGDHAFPDLEGHPLTVGGYSTRMGALRAVRINMEFGGALCRGLKESRYKEVVQIDGEPTLVDFLLERVPPRQAAG